MTAAATPADEWKHLPWKRFERQVFKLQTRIYRAKQRGNVTAVRRLQRLLVRSWSAKCLAVRRVTQDNRGKRTAGVDGVKNLTPRQRLQLATSLRLLAKASPLRRVWIPKPGTDEQRPLSIPIVRSHYTSLSRPSGFGVFARSGATQCCGLRVQERFLGFRSAAICSGVSVIHRGPCGCPRTASRMPAWHQTAIVETCTFSSVAAACAE